MAVLQVSGAVVAVSEGEKEGEALLTLTSAVQVFNVHDCRCVQSWFLSSSDHLTCGAVFLPGQGLYCAVKNGTGLLLWRSEEKALPASQLSLPTPPVSLLTSSHPHHLVLVDATGTVVMVSVENEEVRVVSQVTVGGRRLRNKGPRVVRSVMGDIGGQESVLVMCEAGDVFVCAVGTRGLTVTSNMTLGSKLSQWSVCVCGEILVTAEDNGALSVHTLTSSHPHSLTTLHTGSGIKVTSISPALFAATEKMGVVSVRDVHYGTCLASLESGLSSVEMLWCVCGHLVMCGGDGVRVSRLPALDRASLATVLGRKTAPPSEAISSPLQWEELSKGGSCWRSEVTSMEEVSRLERLSDPQETPTLQSVTQLFPSSLTLPAPSYWPLVRRLARESRFWAHSQLLALATAGAIAGCEAEELLGKALEQHDWALVVKTVTHSPSIPEATLVTLLQHALDLPEVSESYGEEVTREATLWQLLALPYSDSLLQSPLSRLPISSVLSLLQFLTPHVSVASLCRPPPLSYPCLLDWLALLLDTHWPALAVSPSARQLLHNYRHTTYHQMLFCENLATVQSMLEAGKRPPHRRPQEKLFSVEKLKLKI